MFMRDREFYPRMFDTFALPSEAYMGCSYRDLDVWTKSMDLVVGLYRSTSAFPQEERFGLVQQLRRAAVSIPSNIAEGQGRKSRNEFRRFLYTALGSLVEVETQLIIADRLRYLPAGVLSDYEARTGEIGRMLNGLIRSLGEASPVPSHN
jgi:four helix bundle protein